MFIISHFHKGGQSEENNVTEWEWEFSFVPKHHWKTVLIVLIVVFWTKSILMSQFSKFEIPCPRDSLDHIQMYLFLKSLGQSIEALIGQMCWSWPARQSATARYDVVLA